MSVERLTGRKEDGHAYVIGCPEFEVPKEANTVLQPVVDKCADLEDVLGDTYDIDRLRKLVEADKDGRCVVPPCKNWLDLVFGEQEVFWAVDDDYDDKKIREITVRNEERFIWFDGWETVVFNGTDENGLDYEFYPEDVGKTVFLNRESAEAALAKEEQNNE